MSTSPSLTINEKHQTGSSSRADDPPHIQSSDDLLKYYQVDAVKGLSVEQAAQILAKNGPNRLRPPAKPSRLKILLRQITNAMTIVLIGAMAVSLGTQDWIAAGVIGALVVMNISVGYTRKSSFIVTETFSIYCRGMEGRKSARWTGLCRKSGGDGNPLRPPATVKES